MFSTSASSARDPHADTPVSRAGRGRALAVVVVLAVALAAVGGIAALSRRAPAQPVAGATGPAELRVSRDFGTETLSARRLRIPEHATAMSLLAGNARVETAYGGGFVNAIDGLASGYTGAGAKRADWFFFVDGMLADRGAADFALSGADRVWWDFHPWDFAPSVPAVVGQFPQPFAGRGSGRGTLRTTVEYSSGFATQAASVADTLRALGIGDVEVAPLAAGTPLESGHNHVLVGTWDGVMAAGDIRAAAEHPGSSGLFARFAAGKLATVDETGAWTTRAVPAGVVLATARPEEPAAAVWLVTGAEQADVDAAVRLLAGGAPRLQGRFGVAVLRDGSLIGLPTRAGS